MIKPRNKYKIRKADGVGSLESNIIINIPLRREDKEISESYNMKYNFKNNMIYKKIEEDEELENLLNNTYNKK